jgi:hypothetical protein
MCMNSAPTLLGIGRLEERHDVAQLGALRSAERARVEFGVEVRRRQAVELEFEIRRAGTRQEADRRKFFGAERVPRGRADRA